MNRQEYSAVPARQQGVALAMVVWFLAAMSLLVMGIVHQARVDVQLSQIHVARAKVVAAGDGAIRLMLAQHLQGQKQSASRTPALQGQFAIGDLQAQVRMTAASGLLDLNSMPREALQALLLVQGGLEPGEAGQLANTMVRRRRFSMHSGSALESLEGLVQIEGFNRALLDRLRDWVRAVPADGGWLNWQRAPAELQQGLAGALPGRQAGSSRQTGPAQAQASDGVYRVDALISYGGRVWLRRAWVDVDAALGAYPWRVKRTESPRVVGGGHRV